MSVESAFAHFPVLTTPRLRLRAIQDDDAEALFHHETARRVRETPSGFQVAATDHPDGLLVTLTVRHPGDVLNWLQSWGSHVRVLEPESLQALLARDAQAVLEKYRAGNLSE